MTDPNVVVADLGMGNVGSVVNMFRSLGHSVELSTSPAATDPDATVVLAGVGSFDHGMQALDRTGWGTHILSLGPRARVIGICLGMQLLGLGSEEGNTPGLGILPLHFTRLEAALGNQHSLKIPHMGWNSVEWRQPSLPFGPSRMDERFYFVHSFAALDVEEASTLGTTNYGVSFVSVARVQSVFGCQFHPEKSHGFGKILLQRIMDVLC